MGFASGNAFERVDTHGRMRSHRLAARVCIAVTRSGCSKATSSSKHTSARHWLLVVVHAALCSGIGEEDMRKGGVKESQRGRPSESVNWTNYSNY